MLGSDIIIMAGGSGTRLWPASTKGLPKQYLKVGATETFFTISLKRAFKAVGKEGLICIVAASAHIPHVQRALDAFKPGEREKVLLISEAHAKNTGPALAAAAQILQKNYGPGRRALVLTCDHLISPIELFLADLALAEKLAEEDWLSIFGIPPTYPATGFGYIERGENLLLKKSNTEQANSEIYKVASFKEKPDLENAKRYIASGKYFWNAGMFAFSIYGILSRFASLAPDIDAPFRNLPKAPLKEEKAGYKSIIGWEALDSAYAKAPAISFDYAIVEKCTQLALLPARFSWTDIGSWDDWAAAQKEGIIEAKGREFAIEIDSKNCFIESDIPIVLCEVEDLIVVIKKGPDGKGARALISKRGASQKVKEAVDKFKRQGRDDVL